MTMMKIFILAKHLLNAYQVPDTVLSTGLNNVNVNLFNLPNNSKV